MFPTQSSPLCRAVVEPKARGALAQLSQGGHLACRHKAVDERFLQSIEADHKNPLRLHSRPLYLHPTLSCASSVPLAAIPQRAQVTADRLSWRVRGDNNSASRS